MKEKIKYIYIYKIANIYKYTLKDPIGVVGREDIGGLMKRMQVLEPEFCLWKLFLPPTSNESLSYFSKQIFSSAKQVLVSRIIARIRYSLCKAHSMEPVT